MFFFFIKFFLLIPKFKKKKRKEKENGVVLVTLTAAHNSGLTESCIDKYLKLEDWNEKKWKLKSQFCIFT